MKHPARGGSRSRSALVVVVLGVVLALNVGTDPQQDAKQSHLRRQGRAGVRPPDARRRAGDAGRPRGQGRHRELLELVVHPVPAGGARRCKQFYAAHTDDPDFAMVGIVRDDDDRRRSAGVRQGRTASSGRSRSIRGARPRSTSATRGQPETFAISPGGVIAAAKFGPMSSGELETFLGRGASRRDDPSVGPVDRARRRRRRSRSRSCCGRAASQSTPARAHDLATAAQVPGVRGPLGRRQPGADLAGDPRRHQAAHRGRAERRRDPPGLRRQVRRVDPARRRRTPGSACSCGSCPSSCSRSAPPASCSRCAATATSRTSTPPTPTSGSSSASTGSRTPSMAEQLDPERRRQLEDERDFLLRSLDDLELEHESGGIDDESYAELHDDYTARAAAVDPHAARRRRRHARAAAAGRRRGRGARRARRRRRRVRGRRPASSLAYALGARLPGQTASGNSAAAPSTTNAAPAALTQRINDARRRRSTPSPTTTTCGSRSRARTRRTATSPTR